MARPKRAPRAPPVKKAKPSATPAVTTTGDHHQDDHEQRGRTRGRTRATRSAATRDSLEEEDALRAARRSRDAALDRLANEDPTVTSGPEDNGNKNDDTERRSSAETSTDRRRRVISATPLSAARRNKDMSGLDLADDSVFGDLGDSFADGDVPEAPSSEASSTGTTMSHLKTRPRSRQSSMIGRHDPPIRPSSKGGNSLTPRVSSSFNIGVFRRRAREPSILGTSRQAQSRTGGSVAGSVTSSKAGSVVRDSESDMGELESEDEEGLAPEAESTPSRTRRQSRRSGNQNQISNQQKSRLEEKQPSPSPSPSPSPCQSPSPDPRRRSTRKRKSDIDAAQSESIARRAKVRRVEANGGLVIDSESELSDLSSPASPDAAHVARPSTPVKNKDMDAITAPPASSDSEADDNDIWPDIHTLAKRRRRPSVTTPLRSNGDDFSDISTPPSLTHSPNLAATTAANTKTRSAAKQQQRQGQPSPKITTADLTSLLPKRTYKRFRDHEFDIDSDGGANASSDGEPSSDDEQDDDAWPRTRPQSHSHPRPRGRPRKVPPGQSRATTVLKQKRAPETTGGASVRRSARSATKTYRTSEDKENDDDDDDDDDDAEQRENSHFRPLPDDTFDESAVVPDVQNTEELLRATRKFIEVDQWELSYEEVIEPPSPQGAR
ncbi:hypothetical protein E4U21_001303 [Claviceps maximensis]|nr:hypothetical protein E4U21_001303 [Claviceps maximensis]